MIIQSQAGSLPSARQTAGAPNNPGGTFGESFVSELTPVYYSLLKSGRVYSSSFAAITPSAFVGAAAGTPAIGIYNPATSGVDLVLLMAKLAIRTTGTAAVATDWNFWQVNQGGVAVTGTQTQARNMYSQASTGSSAYAMVNTSNTAALASTLTMPSVSIGLTAATAITNVQVLSDDIRGAIVVAPGCYLAWGNSVATTSGSFDGAIIWAEIPA
jgi:hypothetical protein